MSDLANLIFGNMVLIIFISFIAYIIVMVKQLNDKASKIKEQFDKVLSPYLKVKIDETKEAIAKVLNEYGREDTISTEINRLQLTVEKSDSGDVVDKVNTSNAINKFKLNEKTDLEKYPVLSIFNEVGTFKEEELNSKDNGLSFALREYNASAQKYNEIAGGFPIQYLVKIFGLKEKYPLFDTKSIVYSESYEVFDEEEPKENLIDALNRKDKVETTTKYEEKIEDPEDEIVIEHTDIVLKPTISTKKEEQ